MGKTYKEKIIKNQTLIEKGQIKQIEPYKALYFSNERARPISGKFLLP
jgi:hypothetical protein